MKYQRSEAQHSHMVSSSEVKPNKYGGQSILYSIDLSFKVRNIQFSNYQEEEKIKYRITGCPNYLINCSEFLCTGSFTHTNLSHSDPLRSIPSEQNIDTTTQPNQRNLPLPLYILLFVGKGWWISMIRTIHQIIRTHQNSIH